MSRRFALYAPNAQPAEFKISLGQTVKYKMKSKHAIIIGEGVYVNGSQVNEYWGTGGVCYEGEYNFLVPAISGQLLKVMVQKSANSYDLTFTVQEQGNFLDDLVWSVMVMS